MNRTADKPASQPAGMARRVAMEAVTRVLRDGRSLSSAREHIFRKLDDARDRAFAMRLAQGVLRWRWKLDAMLSRCMQKPLRNKEHEVRHILYIALYEIIGLDTPDYAVVDEAVKQVRSLRKNWAGGLVNAVLRKFIKQRDEIEQDLSLAENLSHPQWLLAAVKHSWPGDWQTVLHNNNAIPELHLRVNRRRCTADELQQKLEAAAVDCERHQLDANILVIQSANITELPGYADGLFSVQDAGAQMLPAILKPQAGDKVLDLCAAPGGKACHLIESVDEELELVAVDIDSDRLERVEQNLERLQLQASVMQADASVADWYLQAAGETATFDSVVVDAPCSATGVIRRHPDIKSLRLAEDIDELVSLQRDILSNAWSMVKPGGQLLYVTCSVLAQENSDQVSAFLAAHDDAEERMIEQGWGRSCEHGRQLLPGEDGSDGFYYALLHRKP